MAQMRFLVATIFTLSLASSITFADSAVFPNLGDTDKLFLAQSSQELLPENRNLSPERGNDECVLKRTGGRSELAPRKSLDVQEKTSAAVLSKLNLTETQRQQLQQVRQQYQVSINQRLERLASAQRELAQMMIGTDSATAIRAKHKDIAQLRQAIDNLRFESMLKMRNVLTLEQRQQFSLIVQQQRRSAGGRL